MRMLHACSRCRRRRTRRCAAAARARRRCAPSAPPAGLLYPSYAAVVANETLALIGSGLIQGEQAPLVLLIWGARRVLPVQVQGLSIKEQAFDVALNPIRVSANLTLRILSYRDLDIMNPGYWVFMANFAQKEALAAIDTFGDRAPLDRLLPF
jgi:hypothetical protein